MSSNFGRFPSIFGSFFNPGGFGGFNPQVYAYQQTRNRFLGDYRAARNEVKADFTKADANNDKGLDVNELKTYLKNSGYNENLAQGYFDNVCDLDLDPDNISLPELCSIQQALNNTDEDAADWATNIRDGDEETLDRIHYTFDCQERFRNPFPPFYSFLSGLFGFNS